MENVDDTKHTHLISVIVLAAGMSKRMGQENKLLLQYQESSLINGTLHQLTKIKDNIETIIVLGHQAIDIKNQLDDSPAIIVTNPDFVTGQTSSIQTGIRACSPLTKGYMICLGDMPFIQTTDYTAIIDFWKQSNENNIVRPFVDEQPGHPVIFDRSYKEQLLRETSGDGCRQIIKQHVSHLIPFHSNRNCYIDDIDTKEDKYKLS